MGSTNPIRRLSLELGSVLALLALACCQESPAAPSNSDVAAGSSSEESAPIACFTTEPNPPEVTARDSIVLDASCSANVSEGASYEWDLGNGRSVTGRRVEARYRDPGEYRVTLYVRDGGATSEASSQVRVFPRPRACFAFHQIRVVAPEPCTVEFDASCSSGSIVEYRWFFEGGRRPDLPLPDTIVNTHEPKITYSWAMDMECFVFRPFDRIVRLTVVDDRGASDTHEETVVFQEPFLRR